MVRLSCFRTPGIYFTSIYFDLIFCFLFFVFRINFSNYFSKVVEGDAMTIVIAVMRDNDVYGTSAEGHKPYYTVLSID